MATILAGINAADWTSEPTVGAAVDLASTPATLTVTATAGAAARTRSNATAGAQGVLVRYRFTTTSNAHRSRFILRGNGWDGNVPGDPIDGYIVYPLHSDTHTGIIRRRGGVNVALTHGGVPIAAQATAHTGWRWLRYEVVRNNATGEVRLRAKAWLDGAAEPAAWDVDVLDTDPLTASGGVMLSTYTSQSLAGSMEVDRGAFSYYDFASAAQPSALQQATATAAGVTSLRATFGGPASDYTTGVLATYRPDGQAGTEGTAPATLVDADGLAPLLDMVPAGAGGLLYRADAFGTGVPGLDSPGPVAVNVGRGFYRTGGPLSGLTDISLVWSGRVNPDAAYSDQNILGQELCARLNFAEEASQVDYRRPKMLLANANTGWAVNLTSTTQIPVGKNIGLAVTAGSSGTARLWMYDYNASTLTQIGSAAFTGPLATNTNPLGLCCLNADGGFPTQTMNRAARVYNAELTSFQLEELFTAPTFRTGKGGTDPGPNHLLLTALAVDQSAGSAASVTTGWDLRGTPVNTTDVSGGLATRLSAGTAVDGAARWSWTTARGATVSIVETNLTGTPTWGTPQTFTSPGVTPSLTGGLGAAPSDGVVLAAFGIDTTTGGQWSATDPAFSGGFQRIAVIPGTASNGGVGVALAVKKVAGGDPTETTVTWSAADQAWLQMVFVSGLTVEGATADVTPPSPVAGVKVTNVVQNTAGAASISLEWVIPTDADYAGATVRYVKDGPAPTSPTAGTGVPVTQDVGYPAPYGSVYGTAGVTIGNLQPGTYAISVFARDTSGNHSTAASAPAVTIQSETTAPAKPPTIVVLPEQVVLDQGSTTTLSITLSGRGYTRVYTSTYPPGLDPTEYTYSTTQVTGPDTLTLANATTPTVQISAGTPGSYTLRVTVQSVSTGLTTTRDVPVTVRAVTPRQALWTPLRGEFTLPPGAARVRMRVTIRGALAGERHKLDAHGIFPARVTEWSRGGLAGQSRITVEHSTDGAEWRALPGAANLPAAAGGAVDITDYEAPPGVRRLYRATSSVTEPLDLVSDPSPTLAVTPQPTDVWFKDPTDPSRSRRFGCWTEPAWTRARAQRVVYPTGREFPVVQTSVRQSRRGEMVITPSTVEDENALEELLSSGRVLLLQTPPRQGGRPGASLYCVVTDDDVTELFGHGPYLDVTVRLTEVARPEYGF